MEKEKFLKKKVLLMKYIKSAPFTRFSDKLTYIYGVMQLIIFTFVLGRFPNTLIYPFHCWLMCGMLFGKWCYYKSLGWHYYMFDFCYFANFIVIVYLIAFPKNDYLFKIIFCYTNGCLAIAVATLRNQMVFHKIDNLTSLAIHMVP